MSIKKYKCGFCYVDNKTNKFNMSTNINGDLGDDIYKNVEYYISPNGVLHFSGDKLQSQYVYFEYRVDDIFPSIQQDYLLTNSRFIQVLYNNAVYTDIRCNQVEDISTLYPFLQDYTNITIRYSTITIRKNILGHIDILSSTDRIIPDINFKKQCPELASRLTLYRKYSCCIRYIPRNWYRLKETIPTNIITSNFTIYK